MKYQSQMVQHPLIGMLNYLHKLIDNFSDKIAPVRHLLCTMVLGHTATNSIEARNRSNPSVLSYFNP